MRYTLAITCTKRQGRKKRYTFKTRVVAIDSSDAEAFGESFAESRLAKMGENPDFFSIQVNARHSGTDHLVQTGFAPRQKRSLVNRLIGFLRRGNT